MSSDHTAPVPIPDTEAYAAATPQLRPPYEHSSQIRLYRRMRLGSWLIIGTCACLLARDLILYAAGYRATEARLVIVGIVLTIQLAYVGLLSINWRRSGGRTLLWQWNLLSLFACAFFLAFAQYEWFASDPLLRAIPDAWRLDGLVLLGTSWAAWWIMLMMVHGTLNTRTGWQCGAVCAVVWLAPALVASAAFARHSDLRAGILWLLPVQTGVLLAIAAVVAVCLAEMLERLRRELYDAFGAEQYEVVREIGRGGMGVVYLAHHRILQRYCAVKCLNEDLVFNPTLLKRFQLEVYTLARLTNQHTVRIFHCDFASDGRIYIVMQYLRGLSLAELIARFGVLPPGRAVYFLRQVCRALADLHGHNLVHRDIKPSNIMACSLGGDYDFVKVLDFGIVRVVDFPGPTRTRHTVGTPDWMSPEQLHAPDVDQRSDVYNVGLVGYYLLTKEPYSSGRISPTWHAVPDDLRGVIERCLQHDVGSRYGTARDVDGALRACVCAGDWDDQRAEDWWQTNLPELVT